LKIVIRVDASSQIGTGHFMRCLTLANVLKGRGAQLRFVSRHLPEHCRAMLAAAGHEFVLLQGESRAPVSADPAHALWLGTTQDADARGSMQALSNQSWDWLIVDHYALDVRWESALRQCARRLMVIDDIADRRHDCDLLLDQNLYADMDTRYTGKVPAHCGLLLGPRYALLRDEFRLFREQVRPRSGPVQRVLVFFGGVDTNNSTGRAVEALSDPGFKGLQVAVVIGVQHPYREQIESACLAQQFTCHVQTHRMAELMAWADLAIGAGGAATWERCCLALPTLAICAAGNQARQLADAAAEGLLYAPEISGDLADGLRRHLAALMENGSMRLAISRNAMRAVDGRGVARVAARLGQSGIRIRPATGADSSRLFEWRNHATIRAVSRNRDVIPWADHQAWLASVIADPARLLVIGERNEVPLGVVRFDVDGVNAEVSIYLVPGIAGVGLDLLHSAERWLAKNRPEVSILHAEVCGTNAPSHRLFSAAGYRVESTCYSKRLSQDV
jgi:UDP-2,4-diacetamido-2,4,6-trideoxy-beta-L-altropyranose hydrolase